jgi:hypothetical protein
MTDKKEDPVLTELQQIKTTLEALSRNTIAYRDEVAKFGEFIAPEIRLLKETMTAFKNRVSPAGWKKSKSGKTEWIFLNQLQKDDPSLASEISGARPMFEAKMQKDGWQYWVKEGDGGAIFVSRVKGWFEK